MAKRDVGWLFQLIRRFRPTLLLVAGSVKSASAIEFLQGEGDAYGCRFRQCDADIEGFLDLSIGQVTIPVFFARKSPSYERKRFKKELGNLHLHPLVKSVERRAGDLLAHIRS